MVGWAPPDLCTGIRQKGSTRLTTPSRTGNRPFQVGSRPHTASLPGINKGRDMGRDSINYKADRQPDSKLKLWRGGSLKTWILSGLPSQGTQALQAGVQGLPGCHQASKYTQQVAAVLPGLNTWIVTPSLARGKSAYWKSHITSMPEQAYRLHAPRQYPCYLPAAHITSDLQPDYRREANAERN